MLLFCFSNNLINKNNFKKPIVFIACKSYNINVIRKKKGDINESLSFSNQPITENFKIK